jgi:hypothetical protein
MIPIFMVESQDDGKSFDTRPNHAAGAPPSKGAAIHGRARDVFASGKGGWSSSFGVD